MVFTIVYLLAAWVGIVALVLGIGRSVDRGKQRRQQQLEQHIKDLVAREIDLGYRAAGNPPPPPPNGTRRPQ